jgi:hypothetical protein
VAAGHTAKLWRGGGKVVRLYVGRDYLPVDADGDVDIEDVRSCSSISGSQRRWALYEIIRAAAESPRELPTPKIPTPGL